MERAVIRSILANEELNDDAKLEQIMNLNGAEITRDIRMEKEKTALYMITYKQSGNESVHKQEIAFRKNATAMRKQLESFCRANGLVYYPDRIKIMEGEDIYLRTKGKNDNIAKNAKINSDITSNVLTEEAKRDILKLEIKNKNISTKLNHEKQAPHIYGSKEYDPKRNKSYFTISEEELQKIIDERHATGYVTISNNGQFKETIKLNRTIATHIGTDGSKHNTNRITIHYSKNRTHMVPARNLEEENEPTI